MRKNVRGAKNIGSVPTKKAVPKSMRANPKYMGFRVTRYGPSVTMAVGISAGLIGVLHFLNKHLAHIMSVNPPAKKMIPAK